MKDFLKLVDYSKEQIMEILDLAAMLKNELKAGKKHPYLQGKTLGMIFQKSSTRTRVSFEVGMYQLGGYALFLSTNDIQMGRGEPIEDTAKVLSRYLDGIMIRTFSQQEVEDLAKYATIPVINGLTDFCHPCQVMADFMTLIEYKGGLEGLKAAFIGDGNNMANSIITGGIKMGMEVAIACPKGYEPDKGVIQYAKQNGKFTLTTDIFEAAENADVIFTDVWASMGQESETAMRRAAFSGYIVDSKLMSVAKKDAIVQHCLPAHRGEEISAEVFKEHAGEIYEEAENRLHAHKAIMVKLMADN